MYCKFVGYFQKLCVTHTILVLGHKNIIKCVKSLQTCENATCQNTWFRNVELVHEDSGFCDHEKQDIWFFYTYIPYCNLFECKRKEKYTMFLHFLQKMGQILTIFTIFWQEVVLGRVRMQHFRLEMAVFAIVWQKKCKS